MKEIQSKMIHKRKEDFSFDQKREILVRFGNRCAITGEEAEDLPIHHLVPIAHGGTNDIENGIPVTDRVHRIVDRLALEEERYYPDLDVIEQVISILNVEDESLQPRSRNKQNKNINSEFICKRRSSKGNRR